MQLLRRYIIPLIAVASVFPWIYSKEVLAKEKVRQWQTGKLMDVTSRDASRLANGTSIVILYWTYTVDDGKYVWKLQRDTNRRDRPLDITINADVQFAIEKQDAYLKDDHGDEHKLSVQSKAMKTP